MPVTGKQVAALRAQLSGDDEEFHRLRDELNNADALPYVALTTGALVEAVERRFGEHGTPDDAINFVADVRSRNQEVADILDPENAEKVLMAAFGAGSPKVDPAEARRIQLVLLAALITDERLDGRQLDELLARARTRADELLDDRARSQGMADAGNR